MFRDLTDAMQDYVKEIYKLRARGQARHDLRHRRAHGCLGRPSVTAMLKKLSALGLVEHAPLPRRRADAGRASASRSR